MTKPFVSYRRIDQLKARACDRGFTNAWFGIIPLVVKNHSLPDILSY